jgi:hypothetical protein
MRPNIKNVKIYSKYLVMSIPCSKQKNLASNHFLTLLSFIHKILKTYIIVVFVMVVTKSWNTRPTHQRQVSTKTIISLIYWILHNRMTQMKDNKTWGLPKKVCNTFYTSLKTSRKCLQFFSAVNLECFVRYGCATMCAQCVPWSLTN